MINQFPVRMSGDQGSFNGIINSMLDEFELNDPFLPLPEQTIDLDQNEDYTVTGIQPSSIIVVTGNSNITFEIGNLPSLEDGERIVFAIIGSNYTVNTAVVNNFTDTPCVVVGYNGGWRTLTTGSSIVNMDLADSIFTNTPVALSNEMDTAEAWVDSELRRYFRILNMGELARYQKIIDVGTGPLELTPNVSFPAPPLQAGSTTLTLQAWKFGVHRVSNIPSSIGNTVHTLNIDFSTYDQDVIESGKSSTTYIHFENAELNVSIPLEFINLPANMNWAIDPVEVFTHVAGRSALNFHAIRIERIENTLFVIPYTISPV